MRSGEVREIVFPLTSAERNPNLDHQVNTRLPSMRPLMPSPLSATPEGWRGQRVCRRSRQSDTPHRAVRHNEDAEKISSVACRDFPRAQTLHRQRRPSRPPAAAKQSITGAATEATLQALAALLPAVLPLVAEIGFC